MTKAKLGHRERLVEAMISVAARHGYGGASVARVVRAAGVSRATFYEHFADKEACFLAAFRQVAARVSVDLEPDPADTPREILRRLLLGSERHPAAARLILIEALAGGPTVRAEHEKLFAAIEHSVGRYLERQPDDAERIEIPPRALLGGIGAVIAIRVFRGDTGRLGELLDELMAWIRSYLVPPGCPRFDLPAWERLGDELLARVKLPAEEEEEAGRLPRGPGALPRPVVASKRRERILAATARVTREKGYAAMTVADIVAAAGVSREAFYDQFRNKEDAFLAVQAFALESGLSATAASFFGEGDWPSRVWDASIALVGYVAGHQDFAVLDFVESYAVGAPAIRRSFDSRMAFALFLEDGYRQRPDESQLPRLCSETIAGAMLELYRLEAFEDRLERVPRVVPRAVYVVLAPFIGPVAARDLVAAKVGDAGEAAPG